MKKFFIQNIFMHEIANCIINDKFPGDGKSQVNYCAGVKEIIGLYLLIPYVRHAQLKYTQPMEQIKILNNNYVCFKSVNGKQIKLKNLIDTICHSFVGCEIKDNSIYIVFDDRVLYNSSVKHKASNEAVLVKNNEVINFLKVANEEIDKIWKK